MKCPPPRIVYHAHDSPGRLRVRLSWLKNARDEATQIADMLSAQPGVNEVQVRPFTGSVLVLYDPQVTDATKLRAKLVSVTGVPDITIPGQETPEQVRAIVRNSLDEGSLVAQAAAKCFAGINVDFLRFTGGRLSLGAAAALGLWTAAAAQVIGSGKIELPDWHQLVWWGFRSFGELEESALDSAHSRTLEELFVASTEEDRAAPDPAELHRGR